MSDQVNEPVVDQSDSVETTDTSYESNVDTNSQNDGLPTFQDYINGDEPKEEPVQEEQTLEEKKEEELRKLRLKFKRNGQEVEEEVEIDDLRNAYQKVSEADKRFQEAAQQKQQLEQLLYNARHNPAALLQHLNIDARDFAESYLSRNLEESLMTAEERKARDDREELARYREHQRQIQEQEDVRRREEQVGIAAKQIEEGMMQAIQSAGISGFKDIQVQVMHDAVVHLAREHALAAKQGREPAMSFNQAVQKQLNQYKRNTQMVLKGMEVPKLVEYLGEDTLKKIRDFEMQRVRGKAPVPNPVAPVMKNEPTAPKKHMSEKEARDYFKKLTGE